MKTPTLAFVPLLLQLVKAYTGDMTYYETGTSRLPNPLPLVPLPH